MKRIFLSFSLLFTSFFAFADSKAETPSKSETEAKATTYWVVGISGSNYVLGPSPSSRCDEAEEIACEIVSQNALPNNLAPISHVENQTNGFIIISRQPYF